MLAKFLVDELRLPRSQLTLPGLVCFFFFKDDSDEQKNAISALCALLHQLLVAKRTLLHHAVKEYQNKGKKFAEEFNTLWEILMVVATDPDCGNVICVIDGLDECEGSSRELFVKSLVRSYMERQSQDSNHFLKFIVASRPSAAIERSFLVLPTTIRLRITDEANGISGDIGRVVKARVEEIGFKKDLSDRLQTDLENHLIRNADQTFLWISLVLDMVDRGIDDTEETIRAIIQRRPDELDTLYERILGRSPDPEKAKKILQIAVGAVRPLTLTEMNVVLAIQPEKVLGRSPKNAAIRPLHSLEGAFGPYIKKLFTSLVGTGYLSFEDLKPRMLPSDRSVENNVKELCGPFVRVIESKIFLIHQTAREFLIKQSGSAVSGSGTWKHSLDLFKSNLLLAETCVSYLLLDEFEDSPLKLNPVNVVGQVQKDIDQYSQEHGFLKYAAKHWMQHFRESKVASDSLLKSAADICNTRSNRFQTWIQVYWNDPTTLGPYYRGCNDLMIASNLGLEALVQLFLEKGADPTATVDGGMTAMHYAAEGGYESIVQMLLEDGADVNAKDERGKTPLSQAASSGHGEVVRLLLKQGANVEVRDEFGRTALHHAASAGCETAVRLILGKQPDIAARDVDGETALHLAAAQGHNAVVQLLLEHGANVATRTNGVDFQKYMGAYFGYPFGLLSSLSDTYFDHVVRTMYGKTALYKAVEEGHMKVAELLLNNGSDVDAEAGEGYTPLFAAVENGDTEIVRLLLGRGADFNTKTELGWTPLLMAAERGHEEVVRLLLEQGADLGALTEENATALHGAAGGGHEVLVQLLLDKGADIATKTTDGWTALHAAARNGREAAVRLLLERGADPSVVSERGETPLQLAVEEKHELIVQLLTTVTPGPHQDTAIEHSDARQSSQDNQ